MSPSRTYLQRLIEGCGLRLDAEGLDRLWAYHRMLREANPALNLTRIHNFENMVLKHYVDSLLVLEFEEPLAPLLDMGTGPGLPGIPLKLARPDLPMILAEPRAARAEFLETVIARLGLTGIEVHAGKITSNYDRPAGSVITRAVASIPETLQKVANCLVPGGQMLFMKGPDCDDEVAEARRTLLDRFRLAADHAYEIPGTPHRRRLVVYERLDDGRALDLPHEGADVMADPSRPGPWAREVSSASNPWFKEARDLLTGKGIRKQGRALLAGPRIVSEVVDRYPDRVESWVTGPEGEPIPRELASSTWHRLSGDLFRELDVAGTRAPLVVVRVPEIEPWTDADPWPDGCTLFVPFQDPENVGAVIRTAAAFGVARVVLLREAAHPFHPKSSRAAGTALLSIPLYRGPSIVELRAASAPLIALSPEAPDLGASPWPARFGLVPGVEGPGLPESLRSSPAVELRGVPIAAGVESLNSAAATAVALYDWRRAIRSKPGGTSDD